MEQMPQNFATKPLVSGESAERFTDSPALAYLDEALFAAVRGESNRRPSRLIVRSPSVNLPELVLRSGTPQASEK